MSARLEPQQNQILHALPQDVRARIVPEVEFVDLPLGHVLYESGDTLNHVYFPTDSIVSLLYVMEDGASAEIAIVGNECYSVVKREFDRLLTDRSDLRAPPHGRSGDNSPVSSSRHHPQTQTRAHRDGDTDDVTDSPADRQSLD